MILLNYFIVESATF